MVHRSHRSQAAIRRNDCITSNALREVLAVDAGFWPLFFSGLPDLVWVICDHFVLKA